MADSASGGEPSSEDNSEEQTEITDVEVVDEDPKPAEAVEALSTFSVQHNSLNIKVLPNVERDGTDWRIVVYSRGVRGSLLETNQPLSDQEAEQLGIPRSLQERINDALKYAQQELELPKVLGHMPRKKKSLSELEEMMNQTG